MKDWEREGLFWQARAGDGREEKMQSMTAAGGVGRATLVAVGDGRLNEYWAAKP